MQRCRLNRCRCLVPLDGHRSIVTFLKFNVSISGFPANGFPANGFLSGGVVEQPVAHPLQSNQTSTRRSEFGAWSVSLSRQICLVKSVPLDADTPHYCFPRARPRDLTLSTSLP